MRLTPTQALARLQPQGKAKAKGQQPLAFTGVYGDADNDLFVFSNDHGGILTSALDTLPPILGTWEDESCELPPALGDWLQEYAAEVEWVELMGDTPTPQKAKAKATPRYSVPVMLETKWSQKAPYNDMCIFDGKRCVTGCNATAAAQILYHWREYQRGCTPTDAYTTSTNKYAVDALPPKTVFDYANLVASPKTAAQKQAVAELMAYIGRTMHSNYTPTSTGAYCHSNADLFCDSIRLCDTATAIFAAKIGEAEFERRIYNEIAIRRPVIVGGSMASGGGHAFVVDGYDAEQDLYHVNWGWGGSYNGWFRLSALNPSKYAFNSRKNAVIGIAPNGKWGDVNGDGNVDIADAMQVVQAIQSGANDARYDINYDGKVTITDAQILIDKILGK